MQTKSALIKSLLQSGEALSTRDIADLAQCSARFVNRVKEGLRAYQNGATLRQNLQRLDQDVRDLRALVLHQGVILNNLTRKPSSSKPSKSVISIAS